MLVNQCCAPWILIKSYGTVGRLQCQIFLNAHSGHGLFLHNFNGSINGDIMPYMVIKIAKK